MDRTVEIVSRNTEYKRYVFRIDAVKFRHRRYDGEMSPIIERLVFERGESVAALVHDTDANEFVLSEQFRLPTHAEGPGWLLELPAGIIDHGEDPHQALSREMDEEIGYRPTGMNYIATVYPSPGGSSERIHIFYARVDSSSRVSEGGGLEQEAENIRSIRLTPDEAKRLVSKNAIVDAKTLIAIQWFLINGN